MQKNDTNTYNHRDIQTQFITFFKACQNILTALLADGADSSYTKRVEDVCVFCHFKYRPLSNMVDTLEKRFIAAYYESCVSQILSTVLQVVWIFPVSQDPSSRNAAAWQPGRELPGTGQVPSDPTYLGNTLQLMVPQLSTLEEIGCGPAGFPKWILDFSNTR